MAIIFSPKKADVKSVESSNRTHEALNGIFKQAESKQNDAQVAQLIKDAQKLLSTGAIDTIKTVPEAVASKDKQEIVAIHASKESPKGPSR